MAHPDRRIDLVIVVSGVPLSEEVKQTEKLHHVVKTVLDRSGDSGRKPNEFELRTESGALLELELTVEEAGLVDGQTLFLSPHAGAGG